MRQFAVDPDGKPYPCVEFLFDPRFVIGDLANGFDATQTRFANPRTVRLKIAPIPRSYAPGYPPTLTPAEYRALVETSLSPRIARLVATASVAFSLAGCDPPAGTLVAPKDPVRPVAPDDLEGRMLAGADVQLLPEVRIAARGPG